MRRDGKTYIRWILIFWMFVVSAIAYLDRVNISIAAQEIAKEFHLSNVQLGWIFSAFVIGYALFQAPGGRLADRVGARSVLGLGVIWWGIFTCLITFLPPGMSGHIWMLIVIRFCLGMGEAVAYPASNSIVAAWIPSTERGIANGIIFTGVGFGSGIAPPLITFLLVHYGWRSSFWVSAVLGLIVGAVWFVLARDTPAQHRWVSAEERAYITAGLPGGEMHTKTGTNLSWRAILGNRHIMLLTLSYFAYGYAAYIFFSWFFIYLNKVRGLDLNQSSHYTMLPFLAMAFGSVIGGWLSDRLTRTYGKRIGRCGLAAVSIGLCAIFIAMGTQVASPQIASLVLAGGAGALYLSQSSFWSVTADIGRSSAGTVSGLMNMGGQIGGAVTASLTPAIANLFGWTASFLVAAGLCALGAIAWIFVQPEASLNHEEADLPQGVQA